MARVEACGEKGEAADLADAIEALENTLRKCSGRFYPRSGWAENVEMFLVAGILAIGIRTFFIQPFKITTNSMYPSYHGMTYNIFAPGGNERPGGVARVFRKLAFGASFREMKANASGELTMPLFDERERRVKRGVFRYQEVRGRKWFVLPTTLKEYTFYVGGKESKVRLPYEFGFEKVIFERFPSTYSSGLKVVSDPGIGPVVVTGMQFKEGESIVDFEILSGDALFVDRFSYHFAKPKPGDPFVFRTGQIKNLRDALGRPDDKYYIKRLVGVPGDVLEIREPVLYRNNEPISGADAFARNASQDGEYEGYTNGYRRLAAGQREIIPDSSFYAMGDNSDESSDSRVWGFVPDKEVVGRALFIYYPFTRRWGPAN